MKQLFYFGAIDQPGHTLKGPNKERSAGRTSEFIGLLPGVQPMLMEERNLDGLFLPVNTSPQIYRESVIPPMRIIAWHDYSCDHRPGSHSTFIGYGYASGEEMLDAAVTLFPGVMGRQPRPVAERLL